MRKLFLLMIIILSGLTVKAQSAVKIYGAVQSGAGKAIVAANVSLLNAGDSTLVKVAVSDKDGHYEFFNIEKGTYLISVFSVGFEKKWSSVFEYKNSDLQLPPTIIEPSARNLNNITITAVKPFVETKLDKTIVNVDASPTSAGSTALEILEKSPGVMVNNDGVISLRGKQGVIVMMDGKPTFLSATDLATMLRNMPASALETIEIMTNPSSKYDASGNSGIIDIRTKKGKNNGFNGNVMIGATTSIYELEGTLYMLPKSQNSFNFNYRKNKVNIFGNYNPNYFRGRNTMDMESKQIDAADGLVKGFTDQQTRFSFASFNHTLKLGMDWYANKRNVFGIVASGLSVDGHPSPVTVANMYDLSNNLKRRLITENDNDVSFKNFTGNINWKHTFDSSGRELTADIDYVTYSNVSDMLLNTDVFDGSLQKIGHTELRGHIPSHINIYSFRTDYVRPFRNGKIELGVKSSFVRNNNMVDYENNTGSGWVKDEIRSNHFIYEENINAAYVNVNRQINKWTIQGGLRVENTNAKGNQVTSKSGFKRDSTNLFPTAFVSYALNKKNTFTVSYGRRIQRPNYRDLNPFIFFLDTLSFRQGNIYLKPQYTHNVELSYSLMGKYITTLSYNNTDDVISDIIKPKEGSGGEIRFLTPDNVASFTNLALSVTAPVRIAKWWNLNFFGNVYNNHYKGVYDTIDIDLKFTSFMMNITNSFTIAKGFTAELSGFYRHKSIEQLTRVEPLYQMSIGLQKQVLDGKGTLRLNVRDPFAWQKFEGINKYGYVDMWFRSRPDIRQVTATFTFRFGKQMQQQLQQRRRGSSQEEQNRVGGAG